MINRPQKIANIVIGATGQMAVEKKATAVVIVVRNIATAASGNALAAISSVLSFGAKKRASGDRSMLCISAMQKKKKRMSAKGTTNGIGYLSPSSQYYV